MNKTFATIYKTIQKVDYLEHRVQKLELSIFKNHEHEK